ncbi:16S rRNA (guanine1207-N2)-methyltransferase [Microbacterium sp. AG157]|uniref:class I SAM-dependent methyltransferase n=1 Tax=Microbacterium TaxID=33882 RepID=UPI000E2256BD|nr:MULTISPECIES: class I SAM-dependent methyltransferase [Microbacterium]REC98183.1 16S rRNA (guanine1207-N2)-methyltransferase [Microbacterium sp. AG157]WJS89853.1 methyltransferase [Microbacterium testaceum]
MPFSFAALRRRPDLEGPDLVAVDAADRLILDESADARAALGVGQLVVIGDAYGALTLAAADAGARGIRVHQDELLGEEALALNARDTGLEKVFDSHALDADLLTGARVVLLRLPRSLRALSDIAGLIALHAHPDVVVFAGGRLKHMTVAMNDVLRRVFDRVDVSHARQKSRVLTAHGPHDGAAPAPEEAEVDGIRVRAFGGAFAGASIDIGTRLLLAHLPAPRGDRAVDLACGTGVVAATLAVRHPSLRVIACDQSAIAVASARATAEANGVADRVRVVRDDVLRSQPEATASFIALNPPFHAGAAIHEGLAPRMFADAARVLEPGGELWTVWNSALQYRPALERTVGPTRQVARDRKFTVTVSTKR